MWAGPASQKCPSLRQIKSGKNGGIPPKIGRRFAWRNSKERSLKQRTEHSAPHELSSFGYATSDSLSTTADSYSTIRIIQLLDIGGISEVHIKKVIL
jgi:hypothetical protein